MHWHDRMHEGRRLNKVSNASNTLFNLVGLILVGPISTDLQPCALPPGGKPVPSAALPTWSLQLKAKICIACQKHYQQLSPVALCKRKSWQRGSGDEMWQSQEVCTASYVFPLRWRYSQPVLLNYIWK